METSAQSRTFFLHRTQYPETRRVDYLSHCTALVNPDPFQMIRQRVTGQGDEFRVQCEKLRRQRGRALQFGRADWREICRMREEDSPASNTDST